MITTSYGVGQYQASEAHCLIRPRSYWGGKRAAIFCHGANRAAADGAQQIGYADIPRAIGEDLPVLYADLGGLYTWGNDTSIARVTAARTFMGTAGADVTKIVLMAGSMGAAVACNWARANPTLVQALGLFIPAADVEDIRANNRSGLQAGIETAYTNLAGWTAARSTHNPIEYAAADLKDKGFPIQVWYSEDDPICVPARAQAFITAAGASSVSMGAIGHDTVGVDMMAIRSWITAAG